MSQMGETEIMVLVCIILDLTRARTWLRAAASMIFAARSNTRFLMLLVTSVCTANFAVCARLARRERCYCGSWSFLREWGAFGGNSLLSALQTRYVLNADGTLGLGPNMVIKLGLGNETAAGPVAHDSSEGLRGFRISTWGRR